MKIHVFPFIVYQKNRSDRNTVTKLSYDILTKELIYSDKMIIGKNPLICCIDPYWEPGGGGHFPSKVIGMPIIFFRV